jgi:hypothetical protein
VLDLTYKLRHSTASRKKWNAAAALAGKDLSEWMREALDERSQDDLSGFKLVTMKGMPEAIRALADR